MRTHFHARLTLVAMLAALAMGVGVSVVQTSSDAGGAVGQDAVGAPSTPSVAAAFPSVEAHFALRPGARR